MLHTFLGLGGMHYQYFLDCDSKSRPTTLDGAVATPTLATILLLLVLLDMAPSLKTMYARLRYKLVSAKV